MNSLQALFLFVEAILVILLITIGGLPSRAAAALYLLVGLGLVGITSILAIAWDIAISNALLFREVQISTTVPLGLGYALIVVGFTGLIWTELRRSKG